MKIYIAGPYTTPDPCVNVHNAIKAANRIMDAGHAVFLPHLSHLWHTVTPRPYEDWMQNDMAFLGSCDALVRLPGESSGSDAEVDAALQLGLKVFYGVDDFLQANAGRIA